MTDQVESTANVSGAVDKPNQTTQGALQDSQNSLDVQAVATRVAELLFPEFDKRTQSTKDKRIAELLKGQEELRELLAGQGSPIAAPTTKIELATEQKPVPTPVQVAQPGKVELPDEANAVLLKAMGLDATDPAVLSANSLDLPARIAEYAKIVERNKTLPPASAVAVQSGSQSNALADSYKQEYAALRQGDYAGIVALKAKYREKGLNI